MQRNSELLHLASMQQTFNCSLHIITRVYLKIKSTPTLFDREITKCVLGTDYLIGHKGNFVHELNTLFFQHPYIYIHKSNKHEQ